MKTEEELKIILNQVITNAIRSDSIEQLRFYQGQLDMIETILGLKQDAFTEEKNG